MTPEYAYRRLNRLLWNSQLPDATVVMVSRGSMPDAHALTIHSGPLVKNPIILIAKQEHWGYSLVHEMVHIAEPSLSHGKIFDAVVNRYWRRAKKLIPFFSSHKVVSVQQEEPNES